MEKKAVKNRFDRLEVENALQNKSISVIASDNIHDKRTLYGCNLIPYHGIQHSKIALQPSTKAQRLARLFAPVRWSDLLGVFLIFIESRYKVSGHMSCSCGHTTVSCAVENKFCLSPQ